MSKLYNLSPLNLALDGTLEQFIDLYNFTKSVYINLLDNNPDFTIENENHRQLLNSYAIPMLLPEFELLAFRRLRIFTSRIKNVKFNINHFKHFDFFDINKIKQCMWYKTYQIEMKNRGISVFDEDYNKSTNKFVLEETTINLEGFLQSFRCIMIRVIFEHIKSEDPSYTIFQARKDIDNKISMRMKMRHTECKVQGSKTIIITKSPLYLYYTINNISCKQHNHRIVPKKYYVQDTEGKQTFALPVHYCNECNKYFCGIISYSLFKDFFGKLPIETKGDSSEDIKLWQCNKESKLHKLGYNVVNGALTTTERKNILISLLENDRISYYEMVATIEQNIHNFESNHRMKFAVEKWRNDLIFINDYMVNKLNN